MLDNQKFHIARDIYFKIQEELKLEKFEEEMRQIMSFEVQEMELMNKNEKY